MGDLRMHMRLSWVAAGMFVAACSRNHVPVRGGARGESREWRSLFDGVSMAEWRGYESERVPEGWSVVDGEITKRGDVGDLMTRQQFANFELELEWKIGPRGNSGIFYRATHDYDHIYWSAPEYQLEDNIGAEDNRTPDRWAGSNYALYGVPDNRVNPVGEWNKTRIIVDGGHVEHWLNGRKVVEYELWSPEWTARVAASKFRQFPLYGMARRGYIGIQGDHPGLLALRNIRIRELP